MIRPSKYEAEDVAASRRLGTKKKPDAAENLNFDRLQFANNVKAKVSDSNLVRERRSQILKTAIELFSRKGYHTTTVKEVADHANVSPGLVYQYFQDKEDILFLSLQTVVHSINRFIPSAVEKTEHPVERFVFIVTQYIQIVDIHRSAVELTYRESRSLRSDYRNALKAMETDTNRLIKSCIDDCVKAGFMRPINSEIFVYQVIMSVQAWALKYWRFSAITTIEEYTSAQLDLLLNAALTRKGWQSYRRELEKCGEAPGIAG